MLQSNIYLLYPIIIFIMMNIVFIIAQQKNDNSIVDIFWGMGFIIITTNSFLWADDIDVRKGIVWLMTVIWGLRLSIYIFKRNKHKEEDIRYKTFRKSWGSRQKLGAYLQVFMLQGFFMFVISLPLLHIMNFSMSPINLIDIIGMAIWGVGFYFEAVGDYQKNNFKSNPANSGKVMNKGLWSITRHPNYFGEILMWWGIFIISLSCMRWYISIISPIVITWLLAKVSGVPMLESYYKDNSQYQEYKKNVPALFPKFW